MPPSPSSVGIAQSAAHPQAGPTSLSRLPDSYGKLPISFEANHGQADSRVTFLAHRSGYSLYLTPSEVLLSMHRFQGGGIGPAGVHSPVQRGMKPGAERNNVAWATVRMRLIGSNPNATASGVDPLPGKVNYLIGQDPEQWHTDVPTYVKVRLNDVYGVCPDLGNLPGRQ